MFKIKVDRSNGMVELALEGLIKSEEMQRFARELLRQTRGLLGCRVLVKADMRTFAPAKPQVASELQAVEEECLRVGAARVAEIVESEAASRHTDLSPPQERVDGRLRRFRDDASAREWLLDTERLPANSVV